jgi:hypothetical protein
MEYRTRDIEAVGNLIHVAVHDGLVREQGRIMIEYVSFWLISTARGRFSWQRMHLFVTILSVAIAPCIISRRRMMTAALEVSEGQTDTMHAANCISRRLQASPQETDRLCACPQFRIGGASGHSQREGETSRQWTADRSWTQEHRAGVRRRLRLPRAHGLLKAVSRLQREFSKTRDMVELLVLRPIKAATAHPS